MYIKWKHQAALLQRLTLNAMGDEVYKEIQDAAGGKDAFLRKYLKMRLRTSLRQKILKDS